MKLYFHPASTTSLPVALFCAEAKISYEPVVIDIMTGEHKKGPFLEVNPRGLVPVIEDDGFVLTESSAILKYLAEKVGSPAYPTDLRKRARVNERMDWINTEIYRELGYNLVYPQLLPHHARSPEVAQDATVSWGKEKAASSLALFDAHAIGSRPHVCGDEMTIADYFAAELIYAGSLIGESYGKYPNIRRWLETMKRLPSWRQVNEVYDGFAASIAGKAFVTLGA